MKVAKFELSIRRKPYVSGVPGDDITTHTLKIGGSIKNNGALGGLTKEEEKKYLPQLMGVDSTASNWNTLTKEYWNNISAVVPADGTTISDLQGKVLKFEIQFNESEDYDAFEKAKTFAEKGEASKKGDVIGGVSDFVLFRYCLGYSRVANEYKDANKSAKIWFYLYSKKGELAAAHNIMQVKLKAGTKFQEILTKSSVIDGMLRLFKALPETFEDDSTKHLFLYNKSQTNPAEFIKYAEDSSIIIKSALLEALNKTILYQPTNTTSFYYGENNEILLGKNLEDAVLWWKDESNNTIKEIIKSRLKEE